MNTQPMPRKAIEEAAFAAFEANPSDEAFFGTAARLLTENGYVYVGAPCDCSNGGEFGHGPTCGFVNADHIHA